MNNQCPYAWDAEVVPWDTITVELTANFNVNVNNSAYISATFPDADDSYSTQMNNTGNVSQTYIFSREEWKASGIISDNSFQVATGFDVTGDGATVLPFARDVLARLFQNGYFDFTEAWNIAWYYNYTRVGPEVDPIPTNDFGTLNGDAALSIVLELATPSGGSIIPKWTGGVFNRNPGTGLANNDVGVFADDFASGSVIIPFPTWVGLFDFGDALKIETLRKVADDSLDFGVVLYLDNSADYLDYFSGLNYVATTAIVDVTITITTS